MDELRDAMNAAWDESEKEGDEAALKSEVSQELEPNDDPVISDEVKDERTEIPEKIGMQEKTANQEKEEDTGKNDAAVKAAITEKASKAPASWSPKAREEWANVPGAAQAQIAKREQEVNQVLQQSAEARKAVQSLNSVLAPHREGLESAGYQDPFQAIGALFQTEAGLRTGSSYDRAQGIANLISHYGVDIATLDGILSGQPAQSNPNTEMEDMLDQRMAPINQFLFQQQQQQQYGAMQQQEVANQQVNEFGADKEFLSDVRMDMADLMDMAVNRGEQMTLDQAYAKACAINPEVSSIMQQRQTQQTIMGTHQSAVQKKAAAVSLTGTQGGAGGLNGTLSLRDTIAEAWNTQSG